MQAKVFVLGSFAVDTAYRAPRLPVSGETLVGSSFNLGPGGKGSNQAVAAARAGGHVTFMSAIGSDAFGELGRATWAAAMIDDSLVKVVATPTGAAAILLDQATGANAIIVVPGACGTLSAADLDEVASNIGQARVFVTQLEISRAAVQRGLEIARAAGVITILNPAPAPTEPLTDELLSLADYLVPNETEAAELTGKAVSTWEQAEQVAAELMTRGCRNVILTLGDRGSLFCATGAEPQRIEPVSTGTVLDTTGAGDAFCGAFATALAEGLEPVLAARFASSAAGLAVTRHGAAASMPYRQEIDNLLPSARDCS